MDTANGSDCPTPEDMGRLAAGELEGEERARVLDHVIACTDCGQELSLLRPLRTWAADSAVLLGGRRRWRWDAGFLAAAAVLFLAVGFTLWLRPTEPAGVLRGEEVVWSLTPPAGATLAEPPRRLEVTPPAAVAAGVTYTFQLFDNELAPVWRSPPQDDPWMELPPEVRGRLPRGEAVSWRVVADDGLTRSTSPMADFVVTP